MILTTYWNFQSSYSISNEHKALFSILLGEVVDMKTKQRE